MSVRHADCYMSTHGRVIARLNGADNEVDYYWPLRTLLHFPDLGTYSYPEHFPPQPPTYTMSALFDEIERRWWVLYDRDFWRIVGGGLDWAEQDNIIRSEN